MDDIKSLIDNNRWDVVYDLIKHNKIDPKTVIHNSNNILHLACSNNQKNIIKHIIEKDPDLLYLANSEGNTCGHILASYGYSDILKKLIKTVPKIINYNNDKGDSIISLSKDNHDFTKWYIKKIDGKKRSITNLALHDSIKNDISLILLDSIKKCNGKDQYYSKISKILRSKVDLTKPEESPPLILAVQEKKYRVAKLIINSNADTNIRNHNFITPLIFAVKNNDDKMAALLIKNGASVNYFGAEGDDNLLMISIMNNNEKLVDLLIRNGISLSTYDRYLDTPAHIAVLKKNLSKNILFKILFLSDVNSKNIDKLTPLYLLIQHHNWRDYIQVLKRKKTLVLAKHGDKSVKELLEEKKDLEEFIKKVKPAKIVYEEKPNSLLIKTENVIYGKFNSNMLHSLIYTVILLSKYQNLSVPFQYFNINKANTERDFNKHVNMLNREDDKSINELMMSYSNMFYQLTPYVIIWRDENRYYIHKDITFHMKKSLLSNVIRFIFIKLTLVTETGSSHANIIIYDKKTGIFERFDPYGNVPYLNTKQLDKMLETMFKKFFEKEKHKFVYYSPEKLLNGASFQILSNDGNSYTKKLGDPIGYCLAWTLWYLEQRINNPDINPKQLIKKLYSEILFYGKNDKDNAFINYIRNYATVLDDMKNSFMLSSGVKKNNLYDIIQPEHSLRAVLDGLIKSFKYLVSTRIIY